MRAPIHIIFVLVTSYVRLVRCVRLGIEGMSMDPAVLQELFSKRARRTDGRKSRSSALHQSACTDLSSLYTSRLSFQSTSVMSTDTYLFQHSCPCPYMLLPECDQSYVDRIRHLKQFHLTTYLTTYLNTIGRQPGLDDMLYEHLTSPNIFPRG